MKQKKRPFFTAGCIIGVIALSFVISILSKDKPPAFALNGTELNLASLRISDLNEAGFRLSNNDNSMPGSSFKEMLSYYWGNDQNISMGGVSLLNRSSSKTPYAKCEVFEISAKSMDKDGNLTGLQAPYEGEEFFGKTREELIALFGEPADSNSADQLVYRTKRNQYRTTFYFDSKTGECYRVEIRRHEDNLVR
ncbi:MAG: hypothetical protein K2O97_11935 [Acetatifactor sp.]|nr:hypothetical protein [Acetatifactor sp.]